MVRKKEKKKQIVLTKKMFKGFKAWTRFYFFLVVVVGIVIWRVSLGGLYIWILANVGLVFFVWWWLSRVSEVAK